MNYELAKELKEAGFPWKTFTNGADYTPLLEELIEACGDKFLRLTKHNISNQWRANAFTDANENQWGATPSDAVAKLWLALNKK